MPNLEILFGKFGKPLHLKTMADDRKEMVDDEENEED